MRSGAGPQYVLDEDKTLDLDEHVDQLRKELGDPQLDLSALPWEDMRPGWTDPPPSSPNVSSNEPTALVVRATDALATRSELQALLPEVGFASFDDLRVALEDAPAKGEAVGADVAELRKAFRRAKRVPRPVLDYYARFVSSGVVDEKEPVLRRVLRALSALLDHLALVFSKGPTIVWDVLRDPDAYYLRLRGEVEEWSRRGGSPELAPWLVVLPDLVRLHIRLIFDDRVSRNAKARFLGGLAYVVMPIDLVPEYLVGPAGYIDDVAVLAATLSALLDEKYVSRELLVEHWLGDPERLDSIIGGVSTLIQTAGPIKELLSLLKLTPN